ncbi:MAG: hypothetical protein RI897_3071 [Verrucomicrobiota bacterium]|jgi:hypothetical protein
MPGLLFFEVSFCLVGRGYGYAVEKLILWVRGI